MKFKNPFSDLTKFELILWLTSVFVIIVSAIFSNSESLLSTIASLVGVTALIFVAKGYVLGQALTVLFGILYAINSFYFHYYSEVITYLFMTAPIAAFSIVSWLRHPYKDTKEVEVNRLSKIQSFMLVLLTITVTVIFYFVLDFLNTPNLFFSTISIATSFSASYLTLFRSPYYAIAYSVNDIVLIVLWVLATIENISYLPMIFCFVMFFANDIYGFYSWNKMKNRQNKSV